VVRPTDVALEVDDLDQHKRTGLERDRLRSSKSGAALTEVLEQCGDPTICDRGRQVSEICYPDHAEPDHGASSSWCTGGLRGRLLTGAIAGALDAVQPTSLR
jgi:hypothetical protein